MELEHQHNHKDPPNALPIIVVHKQMDYCGRWPVGAWPKCHRDIPAPLYVKGLFFRQIKIHVSSRSGLKKS